MIQEDMISSLRIELQDQDEAIWTEDDLVRAIDKSVGLMSRLLPKRAMVEYTIGGSITGETLTIASSVGTLTYKPVKAGSVTITGKVLDTDYSINYLTGVVTEIGSNLPDADYTVAYSLDERVLNIASIVPDYIKLERIEYPVGGNPPTHTTFDHIGDFIILRGANISLTDDNHIRIVYLCKWTPPTESEDGDYPVHLDNPVIIGSAGQALVFKAEYYLQTALTSLAAGKTALDDITAVTLTSAPDISAYVTLAGTALTAGIARFAAAVTAIGSMDTPLSDSNIALDEIATELGIGSDYLDTGNDLINAATRGNNVGEVYGQYGQVQAAIAKGYEGEGAQRIALALAWEAKAARENTIGNSYLNEAIQRLTIISRLIEKYQIQTASDAQAVEYYTQQVNKAIQYETIAKEYLDLSGRFLASGQNKVNEFLVSLGIKMEFPTSKALSGQRD